jgi:hypothetical protein
VLDSTTDHQDTLWALSNLAATARTLEDPRAAAFLQELNEARRRNPDLIWPEGTLEWEADDILP